MMQLTLQPLALGTPVPILSAVPLSTLSRDLRTSRACTRKHSAAWPATGQMTVTLQAACMWAGLWHLWVADKLR